MWIIARTSVILIMLLLSLVAESQKIVDTTGVYNGEYTKKRIEISAGGLTEKETWYYPNGRVEQENFYHDGVPYHFISFNQEGKTTAEWGDRKYVTEKWTKTRRWILSLTIVCFSILTIAVVRKNFLKTFYTFLILTLFVPGLVMMAEKQMPLPDGYRNFELVMALMLFLIPVGLFVLSLFSFSKRNKIPWYISILALLISVSFWFFFSMVTGVAGGGILG